ncbi:MAG: hypothetical protein LLG37_03460, partial [Spirochaetia bacterium]|nr:hypothetical protein [Spirochaetia bacterium]
LNGISAVRPPCSDIPAAMKKTNKHKGGGYCFKGIKKYSNGKPDTAFICRNNIEALDPESGYVVKVNVI